jgi:hypothetical protein
MGAGLWPTRATLGTRGWLCLGLCNWRWLGLSFGGMVVVVTKDEALRLALEALKSIDEAMPFPVAKLAIKECKAALEANEFNPDWDTQAVLTEEIQRMAKRIEELEAKDEPVQWKMGASGIGGTGVIVQPQRTWVGLTDDEFKQIMLATYNIDLNVSGHSSDDYLLWYAIEAKLKEKNT